MPFGSNDGIMCLPCIHNDVGVPEIEVEGRSDKSPHHSDHIIVSLDSEPGDVWMGASS